MTGRSFILHRFQARAVLPALLTLAGFQIICLGIVDGDQLPGSGKIIDQKSRKCSLAIPASRENVFEKSLFKDAR